MEKQFIQIQLALFFKADFQETAIEKVSLAIKEEFGNDMGTQILNIPPIAPSEIPRLILTSSLVNINLAKNRMDLYARDINFIIDNFEKINNIITKLSVDIGRVGVVFTYFFESDLNYIKSILNETKLASLNLKEVTVRLNEDTLVQSIKCNNSQMFVSGFSTDPTGNKKIGTVMTRDVNSLAEDLVKNKFEKDTLFLFIKDAISMADRFVI